MNKILNINLGGYALTIDDDAYEYLSAYLDNIRKRFSESEGRDEIIHDIEMRMGELISAGLGTRTIVMLPEIEAAIQIMGKPEDFGGEPAEPVKNTKSSRGGRQQAVKTGKRLFRDEEDVVVAGICSGLSAYFGISDPVWMRLIFVLLTFLSAGFWVPAYLLLWILVPSAKTAADRLAMRGEPVNVDNIAREIEEGFERLSHKVNEFGADAKKKGMSGGQTAFSAGVSAIGQVFGTALRLFAKFWALIAIVVGLCLFIALALGWMTGIWGIFAAAPYVEYFSPYSNAATWLGFTNAFFLLSIPVLGLCLMFARVLFKVRTPSWLGTSLTLFWVLNVVCGFLFAVFVVKEFRQGGVVKTPIDLSSVRSDTLRIETDNFITDNDDWWVHARGLNLEAERLQMEGLSEIRVRRSNSGSFECVQTIRARGTSVGNAEDNAMKTEFKASTLDGVLHVPTVYSIPKGTKWRGQEIKIEIGIPEGKYVVFGKDIHHYARSSEYKNMDEGPYFDDAPNQTFLMTSKGLVCANCPQFGDRNYHNNRDYEHFIIEGGFQTEIRQGDSFRFEIEGSNADKQLIQTIRTGGTITFTTNGKPIGSGVRVLIETPTFTSLHADNSGEITLRGFDEGESTISAKGNTNIKAYLKSNNLQVSLSGKCTLDLTGKGSDLDANLTDGAVLEASNWKVNNAKVSAYNNSKARLHVDDNATVKSDSDSSVKIEGGASIEDKHDE